jgi:hypothetical protein
MPAQHRATDPEAGAQKAAEEDSNPLGFAAEVYKWVAEADKQIVDMQEKAGAPTLAVDAHVLQQLSRIRMVLGDAMTDLGIQLPEDQKPTS